MFLSGCSNPNSENKSSTPAEQTSPESSFKILILGDSLTEGFGITEQEAYPYLLENLLNSELSPQTGKTYQVINGGISGATSSGGVSRIDWFIKANPDFLVLLLEEMMVYGESQSKKSKKIFPRFLRPQGNKKFQPCLQA